MRVTAEPEWDGDRMTSTLHFFPFPMLPIRLLTSARPLSTLLSRRVAAPLRSSSALVRLGPRSYSDSATNALPSARHLAQNTADSEEKTQRPDEPKYSLTFTCKVPECDERTSHMFSKRAYHHGIVIIQCPKCENRCVALRNSQLSLTKGLTHG